MSDRLTGRQRYRRTWLGRLVLQLEFEYRYLPAGCRPAPGRFLIGRGWRDATIADALDGAIAIAPLELGNYVPATATTSPSTPPPKHPK